MSPTVDEKVCASCPHQLVSGVACDWRPADECPYMQAQTKESRTAYTGQVPFAIASETDAIRSID